MPENLDADRAREIMRGKSPRMRRLQQDLVEDLAKGRVRIVDREQERREKRRKTGR